MLQQSKEELPPELQLVSPANVAGSMKLREADISALDLHNEREELLAKGALVDTAPVEDEEERELRLDELVDEPLDECFEEYDSYVDAAAARLRERCREVSMQLDVKFQAHDGQMLEQHGEIGAALEADLEDYLKRTTRITNSTGEKLKQLVRQQWAATRAQMHDVCERRRQVWAEEMLATSKDLVQRFDRELEEHQGHMSKRNSQVKQLLNLKLVHMRAAKTAELRDAYALDRALLQEQLRQHTDACEVTANLKIKGIEEQLNGLAASHKKLLDKLELREFQHAR